MSGHNRIGVTVVVFDVNGTLSNMSAMADAFEAVGAPAASAKTWFAGLLRDGFVLSTVGESKPFAEVARTHLTAVLGSVPLNGPIDQAASFILERMRNLSLHPDVVEGIHSLTAAGLCLITLSNGPTDIAEKLLSDAGIRDEFSQLLSVEGSSSWKPAGPAYDVAFAASGLSPGELLLVAVHPWDIHGAHRVGMRTAWINRDDEPYPSYFTAPDLVARSITELADMLRSAN
ncbi:haloacid dehalogenase type II [Rathayibacter soli]|uniref:haloacid dehalogenase type II n=1 Tax=Rathayibacter soli TaxID=3144168 RepID=UPI0027E530FB|nr:haloacid dehalogenase type II [Glaciibacter superstes]